MTLLEVMAACALLVFGVLSYAQTVLVSARTESVAREQALAAEGARQMLERMRSETFANVFRRYNSNAADDPGGAGTAPGANFLVTGLRAVDGDADGRPGQILFPVTAAAPGILRENLDNASFGTPRDLDVDGVVDGTDHSGDYALLPVIVRVRWRSAAGPATFELRTQLGDIP